MSVGESEKLSTYLIFELEIATTVLIPRVVKSE